MRPGPSLRDDDLSGRRAEGIGFPGRTKVVVGGSAIVDIEACLETNTKIRGV